MSTDTTPTTARPRRKRALLLTGLGVLVVAAIVAAVVLVQRPFSAQPKDDKGSVETATVTRGELTEQLRAQGTLGFSSLRDIGTTLSGIVTGVPAGGTVITAGQELFRINDSPVILLHGNLPVWRAFSEEMTNGADVLQLETNLAALGFFGRTPDAQFTWHTIDAIKKWQKSLGLEQTGMIEDGRIIFSPTDVRIQSTKAAVGAGASAAIVSVTGTSKQVLVYIDTADQAIAPVSKSVTVVLPGGVETTGTIATVGAPVERDGANGKAVKIPVTLTLDDPAVAADLDNVTVSIVLTQSKGTDLLLVPVTALLAQPGGGFAVEVTTGKSGKTKLVPVELGAFASGLVAVTGGGLAEGDKVVVAK
ncbi:peptidoglycan-binding protein [Microbacterium sp. LWO13-1.2]|uniref:peptidoglycan-binding protein n=1 Tax=Microbacterium sp. LWO13-1.2 TaxID=3135262 RepID=UPI003139C6F5